MRAIFEGVLTPIVSIPWSLVAFKSSDSMFEDFFRYHNLVDYHSWSCWTVLSLQPAVINLFFSACLALPWYRVTQNSRRLVFNRYNKNSNSLFYEFQPKFSKYLSRTSHNFKLTTAAGESYFQPSSSAWQPDLCPVHGLSPMVHCLILYSHSFPLSYLGAPLLHESILCNLALESRPRL